MSTKDLTSANIGAAIKVHRALGPGLLESAYRACLAYELNKIGLRVEQEKPIPVIYELPLFPPPRSLRPLRFKKTNALRN